MHDHLNKSLILQIAFAIGMAKSLPVYVRRIRDQKDDSDIIALSEKLSSKSMR